MPARKPRLVVDFFGTLVTGPPLPATQLTTAAGREVAADIITAALRRNSALDHGPFADDQSYNRWRLKSFVATLLDVGAEPDEAQHGAEIFLNQLRQLRTPDTLIVVDGAASVLTELATHYDLTMLSNWSPSLTRTVTALGLSPFFDQILASGSIGYAKPHPAAFHAAAADRERPRIALGDDPFSDVLGCLRAGYDQAILLTDVQAPALTRLQTNGSLLIASSLSQIPAALACSRYALIAGSE